MNSKVLKIYKDGNHYVGTCVIENKFKKGSFCSSKPYEHLNAIFDKLYALSLKKKLKRQAVFNFIHSEIVETYCLAQDTEALREYIKDRIKQKLSNYYHKIKRFRRKANLHKWSYFVTITYDSKKHTEESFRRKLKRTLANFHTRRNWHCMCVWEEGGENGRLHIHGLFYIPENQMVGELVTKKDYSKKHHKMQERIANTFFEKKFGRSDFQPIQNAQNAIEYILKYLQKDNGEIYYSRGIVGEVVKRIDNDDIATSFVDFVTKYVIYDDVFEHVSFWPKTILKNTA